MTTDDSVGVLGATSIVGRFLLGGLPARGRRVLACSRDPRPRTRNAGVTWCRPVSSLPEGIDSVPSWIALCPLWATLAAWDWLLATGLARLVVLSSTSVISKRHSPDHAERDLAARLARAEEELVDLSARTGVRLVILRPTMIYDGHSDGNVAAIVAWASRWGWFPVCGQARGLRQPVHADDVAAACLAALDHPDPRPTYTLSGGEALPFRDLVRRSCQGHGLSPLLIHIPGWIWLPLAIAARGVGMPRQATAGMAARMNEDLVFDHSAATGDLGFHPRPFSPSAVPPSEADCFGTAPVSENGW